MDGVRGTIREVLVYFSGVFAGGLILHVLFYQFRYDIVEFSSNVKVVLAIAGGFFGTGIGALSLKLFVLAQQRRGAKRTASPMALKKIRFILPPKTVRDVLQPTIADMEHEVLKAKNFESPWRVRIIKFWFWIDLTKALIFDGALRFIGSILKALNPFRPG